MQKKATNLGKRKAQDISEEDLKAYNTTKKKVFAVIPFDKISNSGLMDSTVLSLVKQFGSTEISSNSFFS